MTMRVAIMLLAKVSVGAALATAAGCTHAGGKLMVDSPVTPYRAPDISDITGMDGDDDDDAGSGSGSAAAGSGSAHS